MGCRSRPTRCQSPQHNPCSFERPMTWKRYGNNLPDAASVRARVDEVYSIYPFNEFEHVIATLLGRDALSIDQYYEMRDSYMERMPFCTFSRDVGDVDDVGIPVLLWPGAATMPKNQISQTTATRR